MADPPVTSTPSTKDERGAVGEEQIEKEEFLVVKDGYFRYIDILFEWCKYMNPWQVCLQTISAVLNFAYPKKS
jgi:hypothetical protein